VFLPNLPFPLYFDHDSFMHHALHVLDAPDDIVDTHDNKLNKELTL